MASTDILRTGDINPEFEPIWTKIKDQIPDLRGDVEAVRKTLVDRKKAMTASHGGGPSEGIVIEDITVQARDGYKIPCVLYKPAIPPDNGSPLFIVFHGGGFMAGTPINEDLNCRLFVAEMGFTCVNVDYRLAPENPFPYAQNDGWDVTKWAAKNASSLGADPTKGFIIGGTSAGGCITDVVGHLARDENLSPPITGLLEMIPVLIPVGQPPEKYSRDYLAWEQNKDAPILPRQTINWMTGLYKPDFSSWLAFPMLHPKGHAGMPPVFFQVCGMDPLRDDSIIYERLLREEHGTPTRLKMYPGVPHGWWSTFPQMELSKQFVTDTVEGVKWLLSLVQK